MISAVRNNESIISTTNTPWKKNFNWCARNVCAFKSYPNESILEKLIRISLGTLTFTPCFVAREIEKSVIFLNHEVKFKNLNKIDSQINKESEELSRARLPSFWSNASVKFPTQVDYPPITESQANKLKRYADLVLVAQERLTKAGIPCWIDGGTLLGVYRYGDKQLPHDYDVDICILHKDAQKAAKILFDISMEKPLSYTFLDLSSEAPGRFMRLYTKLTCKEWMGIESYVVNGEDNTMDMVYGKDKLENVFPLVQADFYGKKVWVPNNTEKHLLTRYQDLTPISYWCNKRKSLVLNLDHSMAASEKKKIEDGKVKNILIPTQEEHDNWKQRKMSGD